MLTPRPGNLARGWLARPYHLRLWPAPALAAATALTLAVAAHPGPMPGEVALVDAVQAVPAPASAFADVVLAVTSTEAALVLLVPLTVLLTATAGWRGLLAGLVLVVAMLVAQPGLKDLVDRPRPDPALVEVRAGHDPGSESYPSGHSLSTAAVWGAAAGAAWVRWPRVRVALLVPVVLAGAASLVQGTHWPSDLVGGTLVGALAAWCAIRLARDRR